MSPSRFRPANWPSASAACSASAESGGAMRIDWREVAAACAPGLLLAVAALLGWLIAGAVLDPAQWAVVGVALEPVLALLLALWLVLAIGAGWWTHRGWLRRVRQPAL